MTDFAKLLAKYPPKHGERTAKVIARNAVTDILDLPCLNGPTTGGTDWAKQDSLHHMIGAPNATLNDPIPVRGVTQVKKKKPGKGKS